MNTVRFSPFVASTQMEGTVSQIFDIGPSFYFMIKKREAFCNVFHHINSLTHKMRFGDTVPSIHILGISSEKLKYVGLILSEIFTIKK